MSVRVLLVDDEEGFATILAERLQARGLDVVVAFDGESALPLVEEHDPDVAVLDVNLPGMSGLDLLEQIKACRPSLQVVMLTGQASATTAVEGMKRGALDYLFKPVDIEALTAAIRLAAERKIGQEESLRMIETGKMAAVGMLAQGVAHEINNPVNIMVQEAGWIEDLLDDLAEAEVSALMDLPELRRAVGQITLQGRRCKEITKKLLSLGRRIDPRPRELDMGDLLGRLAEEVGERAAAAGVAIETRFSDSLPVLSLSPAEMMEVFKNLIDNGLDAMAAGGGTLRLTTRLEDGRVEVQVSDTGHGIPSQVLPHIFEPFFSTKEVGKGTGLGLSICYSIVSSLGGEIVPWSSVGMGTIMTVRIPFSETGKSPGEDGTPQTVAALPGRGGRSREIETSSIVLLIQSGDEDELQGLRRRLEPTGLGLRTSRSGAETLEAVRREPAIDAVLVSVPPEPDQLTGGPHEDPVELVRAIRAENILVQVLLLADDFRLDLCRAGIVAGAFDFLRKPLGLDELLVKLEEAKLHRLKKQARIQAAGTA